MLVSPAESEILRTAADKVWTQQTPAICNISAEYVKNAKCTAEKFYVIDVFNDGTVFMYNLINTRKKITNDRQ